MSGVYISYPFCNQKCTFCNFSSGVFSEDMKARYQSALLKEVHAHTWRWLPETVYFGGGTPSLMPADLLSQLLDVIPAARLGEVTLECAPGSITRDRLRVWKECGVNRVSLGVQSFIAAELRLTGRKHTAEVVAAEVAMLRDTGIANINIDLIVGLPGQTIQSWKDSLDWLERLQPPHVSVYIFEIDEDSRLGNELLLGGSRYSATTVPDENLTADLYEIAVERLANMEIRRYEISNFALPGWESRHNLKYWELEPYVGFGLDAHSFDGKHRWSNPNTLEAYFAQQECATPAPPELILTDISEEHFFVGLRLAHGIEPTQLEWSRFAQPIEKHVRAGMLEHEGKRLRLSKARSARIK